MALRRQFKMKHAGVQWRSGLPYSFKYTAYENDPNPMFLYLYTIRGTHRNTGKQWNLMQGINLNYIPRQDRKRFVKIWKEELQKTKSVKLTWEKVKTNFPYIKIGIRRYLLSPKYYIRNARAIEIEDMEKEIIRSMHKDFSKAIKRKLASKLKKLFAGKRR